MEIVCSHCSRIFNSDEQSPGGSTKCPFCEVIQKPKLISVKSASFDIADFKFTTEDYKRNNGSGNQTFKNYFEMQQKTSNRK